VPDSNLSLGDLRERWNDAGRADPFWAVLSWADKTNNRWTPEEFFRTGVDEIRDVMSQLKQLDISVKPGRALDFGCGPGRLTRALASHFERVDGVDISPSMIELANRFNEHPNRCHYHLNVADDLALFADSTFDFIYSNITLQHVGQSRAKSYLREFLRILNPGGVMVFQLPGRLLATRSRIKRLIPPPLRAVYRRARNRNRPGAEMHGMPREQVIAFVSGLGAELQSAIANTDAGTGWESFRYVWRRPPEQGSPAV
jgi:SAM-dependent methyltransferase